jgi:branched-chain amino acid transport system substrate-binding protein
MRSYQPPFFALLFVAAAMLSAPGCDKPGKTIKIATQCPLTGDSAIVGADIQNGTKLAVEQLSGPLVQMGFKVKLIPFDDQGKQDNAVANAKTLISDPIILGVVGHLNSEAELAASEAYHAAKLCHLTPASSSPQVTDRGYEEVNRLCGRDDVQCAVCAQFTNSLAIKSVYVVHNNSESGKGNAEFFKREAQTQGINVVGFEGTEEKSNFDAILNHILAAKAESIFFGGEFERPAELFKQARQKGFKGMCLSDGGFDSSDAVRIGGFSLLGGAGTFYSTVAGPAKGYPDANTFLADFKNKFGKVPQPYAAQAYDSVAVLLKGIENAIKSNNGQLPARADVVKAVRSLKDFKGITGTINFNPNGDLIKSRYFIIQVMATDPTRWPENNIHQTMDIGAPYKMELP